MDSKLKFQFNKSKIKLKNVNFKKDTNINNIELNENINKQNYIPFNINLYNFKREKISNSIFYNRNINKYNENLYINLNDNEPSYSGFTNSVLPIGSKLLSLGNSTITQAPGAISYAAIWNSILPWDDIKSIFITKKP